jgi:hypothetical protein
MDGGNKARWAEIVKATKKCPYCPKHGKENASRRERTNRYKNINRKKVG